MPLPNIEYLAHLPCVEGAKAIVYVCGSGRILMGFVIVRTNIISINPNLYVQGVKGLCRNDGGVESWISLTLFYIADLCKGSTIEFESMCSGSSPLSATNEVITMAGSKIAKEIIDEQKEEKAIKVKLLREVYRKRRGESNGKRTEPKAD